MYRKKFLYEYVLGLILLLSGAEACFAQIYPVQVTTQLIPPYSSYLGDYADPGNDKLRVILQFNDFTRSQYEVKLQFIIKGNGFSISTKPTTNKQQAITLFPGVPHLISGSDLLPYLDTKNLDFSGINISDYEKRKSLPEGFYTICITAFDFYNPQRIQVSNESCASAWFVLNDPPLLNLPLCKSTVKPSLPQQVTFQWTPMNMGSPNSAMNTEYVFELFEVRPAGADPNQVVQTLPPVFSVVTDLTMINYGITETPLQEGMEYAWRLRARDKSGRDLFKNQGYSQVCSFLYGNILPEVRIELGGQASTHRQAKLWWTSSAIFEKYLVQVRKSGYDTWFDFPSTSSGQAPSTAGEQKINDLEPGTTYEARVQGSNPSTGSGQDTDGTESPWSNTLTFKTNALPNYNCNDSYIPMDVLPSKPLHGARPGIIVKAGQFEMLVTSIYSSGPPGRYSGLGKIPLMGMNMRVQFKNIFIDDNHTLQDGEIDGITEGLENKIEQWEKHRFDDVAVYTGGGIDSIRVRGDSIFVTLDDGKVMALPVPTDGSPVVLRDDKGNEYVIAPDGKVLLSSYQTYSADSLQASDSLRVTFSEAAESKYGFDEKKHPQWAGNYEIIKMKNGEDYFVAYKSVGEGSTDLVNAQLIGTSLSRDKLKFISGSGKEIAFKENPSTGSGRILLELTVPSDAKYIYAFYNGKKAGKLNVIRLKPIEKKLVIVPVGSSPIFTGGEGSLNSIFSRANVHWTVKTAPAFNDNSWDVNNDGKLQSSDASLMNKYSEEMRLLKGAYRKKDSLYDKEALYIFLVPGFSQAKQNGYMVRGKAVGFVLAEGLTPDPSPKGEGRNISHELCHGAFGLEHTFPGVEQGTTDNLMDYGDGTVLTHKQWMLIQEGVPVLSWFDQEEDALSLSGKLCKDFDAGDKYFIAPNGKAFKLPKGAALTAGCLDMDGVLGGFTFNGKQFLARYSMIVQPDGSFSGYQCASETFPLSYVEKIAEVYSVFADKNSVNVYRSGEYRSADAAENSSLKGTLNNDHVFLNGGLKGVLQCAFPLENKAPKSQENKYLLALGKFFVEVKPDGGALVYENGFLLEYVPGTGIKTKAFSSQQLDELKKNIADGNFSAETATLFEKKNNGGYSVKIGFNKSISARYGNSPEVKKLAARALEQRMDALLRNVNDLTLSDRAISSGSLPDGKKIEVRSLRFFDKVIKIVKQGRDIIVNAQIPEQTWDGENPAYNDSWFKIPAVVGGLGDGAIEQVKDIPVLVAYGADLVVSQESRDQLVSGFKNLSWDKLKSGLVNSGKDWVSTYSSGSDRAWHQGGKDAVLVYTAVIGGAKMLLEKTKTGIEKSADEVAEVVIRKGDDAFDVSKIAHLLKTEPNTAFFWSGKTNGVGGEVKALEIAKSKGGITIEGIIKEKGIDIPKFDFNNPASVKAWEEASAVYASQVTGEIRAVIGKELRAGSVWETIELPRLKNNDKITKIIAVDPETLVETVIFTK